MLFRKAWFLFSSVKNKNKEDNNIIDIEAIIPDIFSRIIEKPISKLLILEAHKLDLVEKFLFESRDEDPGLTKTGDF